LCVQSVRWTCLATDSFWFRSPQRLARICSIIPLTCGSLQHILPMDYQSLCSNLHFAGISQISWGPVISMPRGLSYFMKDWTVFYQQEGSVSNKSTGYHIVAWFFRNTIRMLTIIQIGILEWETVVYLCRVRS
jgi:hypothetical protein